MDWNDENLTSQDGQDWWQATVSFPGDAGVSHGAAAALVAALSGLRFHFLRKEGKLRLRTDLPAADRMDQFVADQWAVGWVGGVYEPEIEAFGGKEGMAIAHQLFCADSPAALAETGLPRSRERCVLLISAMNRSAGLDPFETGDVWAKIANLRPAINSQEPAQRSAAITAMRRLMNADAGQRDATEPGWSERVAAFEDAGRQLARLSTAGMLTRGIRAVLAHHAIFALNRAGVPVAEQAAAAWLGQRAVFTEAELADAPNSRPSSAASTVERMETDMTSIADPVYLRETMVAALTRSGHLRTREIIDAFLEIERHRFIPDADVQAAYAEDAVAIKHDGSVMVSCISAPSIVATQLEQLGALPGHVILEVGAATGYNAALLARLVAPGGHVWTVDVDQDLVDGAAAHIAAAKAANVTVILADGAAGLAEHAPFDRMQFTVGAGDIPIKILDQLAPGGRLVIPMRIRGSISRSFAFERDGDIWKAVSCEMATFVPLRKGICNDIRTMVPIAGGGNVKLEIYSEQDVDRDAMRTVLDQPRAKVYTDVKFRQGSPWEWVYLWLACVLPNGLSRMPGQRPGFKPHFSWGSMAAVDRDTLAYLTVREGEDTDGPFWEIGVIGHGPDARGLAENVATAITEWARDYGNDAPAPGFRMATETTRELLTSADPRFIIDKTCSRLVVDWP